jgi:hypothetical protein
MEATSSNPKLGSSRVDRPRNGDLIAVYPDGRTEELVVNKPFALLQVFKRQYVAPTGGKLKLTYTGGNGGNGGN